MNNTNTKGKGIIQSIMGIFSSDKEKTSTKREEKPANKIDEKKDTGTQLVNEKKDISKEVCVWPKSYYYFSKSIN